MKTHQILGTAGLFVAGALGSALAQQTPATQPAQNPVSQTGSATTGSSTTIDPNNATTYATGQPLQQQSHEGFWGHMNPMARKKWVHRQIDPVVDRENELDQLQAKNANDIRDVDSRATTGINRAMTAANTADQHAADAASRADQANSLAVQANGKTTQLSGTVSGLDQYSQVTSTAMPFYKGRTTLTARQKADLDQVAGSLAAEKGYIVEVQGFSRAGVASSQAMADSVVRYLVVDQHVPVYRIYRTGLGNSGSKVADADPNDKPLTNGVRVTIMHNSLASMGGSNGAGNTPSAQPAQGSGQSGVSAPSTR